MSDTALPNGETSLDKVKESGSNTNIEEISEKVHNEELEDEHVQEQKETDDAASTQIENNTETEINEFEDQDIEIHNENEEIDNTVANLPPDQNSEEKDQKEVEKETTEQEVIEDEQIMEEPPPDPTAPLNLNDSSEALKPPFELNPEQIVEVENLWELFQNYTPVYTDINNYITEKELVYLLKSLLLMTYTEEQLQELIAFCVRPPHPKGHINYDQFLRMVTIRQRDLPIEEELRSALQVLDPEKTGQIEREHLKEVLRKLGNKMPEKLLENFVKEVDMSNDGKIGIEDVVGTMGIDLNKEDLLILMSSLNPKEPEEATENA